MIKLFCRSHYADFERFIEKINGCKNNIESSSTKNIGESIPSGFLMSTTSSFGSIENKHDLSRGKIVWKSFVNR